MSDEQNQQYDYIDTRKKSNLNLAIISAVLILLSLTPLCPLTFLVAIAILIIRAKKKKTEQIKAPGATLVLAILALVLSTVFCGAYYGSEESSVSNQNNVVQTKGTLSFIVDQGDWDSSLAEYVIISVTGTTSNGEPINKNYQATPNQKYNLEEYTAGKYTVCISSESRTFGEIIYKANEQEVEFDGKTDKTITIKVEKDTEAIAAAAEAKAKAEAEAKAKAEAEAKAQAEASAKSTSTKNATSNATSSSSASSSNDRTVYITNTGTKYHKAGCRHLKSSSAISLSQAQARGYTPCGTCGG